MSNTVSRSMSSKHISLSLSDIIDVRNYCNYCDYLDKIIHDLTDKSNQIRFVSLNDINEKPTFIAHKPHYLPRLLKKSPILSAGAPRRLPPRSSIFLEDGQITTGLSALRVDFAQKTEFNSVRFE